MAKDAAAAEFNFDPKPPIAAGFFVTAFFAASLSWRRGTSARGEKPSACETSSVNNSAALHCTIAEEMKNEVSATLKEQFVGFPVLKIFMRVTKKALEYRMYVCVFENFCREAQIHMGGLPK